MEQLMKILTRKLNDEHTLGLLFVEKEFCNENNLELDVVLIKITNNTEGVMEDSFLSHFNIANKSIGVHIFNEKQISFILNKGQNRHLLDWLLNGVVLVEKSHYITDLRRCISEFPIVNRSYKIGIEFSKLIKRYKNGKQLFQKGHLLDSFNSILHALHHLARISVIEHGIYPEVTVWQQVKQLEPEIYKLYEEMVTGEEVLEKRIELLLIATNFAITSKTKIGTSHLLEVMKVANEPWSVEKLLNQNELKGYGCDLVVLLEYLVQKGVIDIVKVETGIEDIFSRLYSNK